MRNVRELKESSRFAILLVLAFALRLIWALNYFYCLTRNVDLWLCIRFELLAPGLGFV